MTVLDMWQWIVQKSIPLVTKATNPKYIADDIDLFDFTLTDEEMSVLSAATKPKGKPSFFCSS